MANLVVHEGGSLSQRSASREHRHRLDQCLFRPLAGSRRLLKTGVMAASRYEPGINRTYQEMAAHYGTAIVPTRVRKPRDKAKVEVAVQVVERWVLPRLRHRRFFSLGELNAAIRELTDKLNNRTMRRIGRSRRVLGASIQAGPTAAAS